MEGKCQPSPDSPTHFCHTLLSQARDQKSRLKMETQSPPLPERKLLSHLAKALCRKQLNTALVAFIGLTGLPPEVNMGPFITI